MAQKETRHTQNSCNSALSADAESFIPRHTNSSASPPGLASSAQPKLSNDKTLTQVQLSQLPRYVTSCYPFVKGDNTSQGTARAGSPGRWHGPSRPRGPQSGKQHRPNISSSPGVVGFNQRCPTPRSLTTPRTSPRHILPGLLPGPGAIMPSRLGISATSGVLGYQVSGNVGALSPSQPAINPCIPAVNPCIPGIINPVGLPLGQAAMWTPQMGQDFTTPYPGAPVLYTPFQLSQQDWSTGAENKKQKKGDSRNSMISIGIQNESGVHHSTGSSTKRKAKTKTLICKNADSQTDFSDEIANLTLAEKPCPLYQKDHHSRSWLQHYNQDSSTDSEEKDSDSGYSSPQHRRNQASNGTHPVVGITPYVIPGIPTTLGLVPPHPGPGLLQQPPFVPTSLGPYNGFIQTGGLVAPAVSCYQHTYQNFSPEVPTSIHRALPPAKPDRTAVLATSTATNQSNQMNQSASNLVLAQVGGGVSEQEDSEASSGKKRRHRSRHKNRLSSSEDAGVLSDDPYSLHRTHSSSSASRMSTATENDLALHFDDEDEFPNLLSAAGGLPSSTNSQSSGPMSYSDILKNQASCLSQESSLSGIDRFNCGGGSETQSTCSSSVGKESKNARKRRKRRELANRAADEELAEICLEQTVLKELRSKSHLSDSSKQEASSSKSSSAVTPSLTHPKAQPAGKKSKQPISLNFADMISALEKQQEDSKSKKEKRPAASQPVINKTTHNVVANPLDSSAPVKRGKEREAPKVKKPSPLKKVILKEREEKKRLRLLEDDSPLCPNTESPGSSQLASVAGLPLSSDLSQEATSSKAGTVDFMGTPVSAEMSPISQTSPISMSPLSGSPLSSGVNSPVASNTIIGNTSKSSVLMKIHSRRFREYCNQVLDKNIDECCTLLLQDLVRFQDRLYHKDPTKAKAKRRIVLGLREVTKHLKLNRIKCVIISPNMERIQSKGGLDEALNNILDLCTAQDVPFVFALGRRALGRACAKLVPVSVAGIFNYDGSEENFKKLMTLSEKARNAYKEMVALLEQEMEQQPQAPANPVTLSNPTSFSHLFAHLGHSRTPSACSAISFTSSILSEPISENYPHSEPETDSRGYEIVSDKLEGTDHRAEQGSSEQAMDDEEEGGASDSLQSSQEKVIIVESLDDNGHEADNEADEEDVVSNHRKRSPALSAGVKEKDDVACDLNDVESVSDGSGANSVIEKDDVEELPHIDSIHSMNVDISAEILSQHSSKTLDLNAEVLSTHSSKTLEAERCGYSTPERPVKSLSSTTDLHEASPLGGSSSSRIRNIDSQERVQSWVVDSQKHLDLIGQCSDVVEDQVINNNTDGDSPAKGSSINPFVDAKPPELASTCSTCITMQKAVDGMEKLTVSTSDNQESELACRSGTATSVPIT